MASFFPKMLVLAFALAVSVVVTVTHLDSRAPQDDARQFARMAYSLVQAGVLSTDDPQGAAPEPTARREPLYPAILALSLKLFAPQDLAEYGGRCFVEDGLCPQAMFALRLPNILLHIVLALATGWAAWILTEKGWVFVAAGSVTALFSGFISESNILYAETLGGVGVIAFSVLLYEMFSRNSDGSFCRRKTFFCAALCGVCFGLLILVKAVFFYLLILLFFAAVFFVFAAAVKKASWQDVARFSLVPVLALVVIFPWMARNHAIGQGWGVSGRGDEILAIRASYDSMPWKDVPAAFFAVIPVAGERLVTRFFDAQTWARFDRESPVSYYRKAKTGTSIAHEIAAAKNITLKSAALEIIRDNAVKHILLTGVFAFRSAFPQVYMRQQELPAFLLAPSAVVGILFVPAMLCMIIFAAAKRRVDLAAFLAPSLFSFAFHAALTHDIPRYSMMLYPVFIVCLVALPVFLLQGKRHAKES